jgi:AraC family transcriptional activator of pobA
VGLIFFALAMLIQHLYRRVMKDIPVHQLQSRSDIGLEIRFFGPGDIAKEVETLGAHRDDHYIFFLLKENSGSIMIDFHEVTVTGPAIYYVLPGQVHHRIRAEEACGWYIAVDTMLVPPAHRNVFENQLLLQHPFMLTSEQLAQCCNLLCLLDSKFQEDKTNTFYLPVVHSLLQSFVGIAAGFYNQGSHAHTRASRTADLSQQFKILLVQHMRNIKSPSAYAELLNVSESYLNEALKKTTGLTVSYWIQHELLLEAKRMLYYSGMNVKEIAHNLGYDDQAYFSRQFKRVTGLTPLGFRGQYRK